MEIQCYCQGRNYRWYDRPRRRWCRRRRSKSAVRQLQSPHSPIPSLPRCLCWLRHRYIASAPVPSLHSFANTTSPAVLAADRASANYDIAHNPDKAREIERERSREALYEANKTAFERSKEWASDNRYPILFGVWVASMAGSWALVSRSPMSGSQKLVQARMYAQGLTLTALLASFAFEGNDAAKGRGRWETIKVVDPNDPEHKHLIEKKIHHERYAGEDQWRGMLPLAGHIWS